MANEFSRRVLPPAAGVSREIGFYLAGMNEVREQLREAVAEISLQDLGRLAVAEAHSIGALVLHIGEAEWWWMQCVISGHKITAEEAGAAYWDVLKDPRRVADNAYSAQFCLDEISKIREQSREVLASFSDDSLDRVFSFERD